MQDYKNHFDQFREQITGPIKVFEIGGGLCSTKWAGSPVLDGLMDLTNKQIIYREIHDPFSKNSRPHFTTRDEYSRHCEGLSPKQLESHPFINFLSLPWDASNIPYLISSQGFHEVHCHMINSSFLSNESGTTIDQFAIEMSRIGSPGTQYFFSMEEKRLFGPKVNSAQELIKLCDSFAKQNILVRTVHLLIYNRQLQGININQFREKGITVHEGMPNLSPFSVVGSFAAYVFLAEKTR